MFNSLNIEKNRYDSCNTVVIGKIKHMNTIVKLGIYNLFLQTSF